MPSQRGLLVRIVRGEQPNKNAATDVEAIVEHLRYLLNTRLGESITVPDYGIEDLSDLTNFFPEAADDWKASIRRTIDKYEPRLTQVRVSHRPTDNPLIIGFELSARLTFDKGHRPVQFQTEVDTTGIFKIK